MSSEPPHEEIATSEDGRAGEASSQFPELLSLLRLLRQVLSPVPPGDATDVWPESSPFPADYTPPMMGRFRLLRQLGWGGFGIVFLAEDTQPWACSYII